MKIIWTETARLSYAEELDFINRKWGNKEVAHFIELSEEFLQILTSGLIEGKPTSKLNIKLFVISKQTTVVYKIDKPKNASNYYFFGIISKTHKHLSNFYISEPI